MSSLYTSSDTCHKQEEVFRAPMSLFTNHKSHNAETAEVAVHHLLNSRILIGQMLNAHAGIEIDPIPS